MILILIYILTVVLSYKSGQFMLKNEWDNINQAKPPSWMVFVVFVPLVNLSIPIAIIAIFISDMKITIDPYKFFKVKKP